MFNASTKFLVVDDLKTIRTLLRETLNRFGYQNVQEASDGEQALQKLKAAAESNDPFGFVICDWNLPGITGLDVLQACKKDQRLADLPFLMVTIESEKEYVLKAAQLGVSDYMVKPFNEHTLLEKLRRVWQQFQSSKP